MSGSTPTLDKMNELTVDNFHLDMSFVDAFMDQLKAGLDSRGEASDFKMLDSCVQKLPDGSETGVFYAIDFGGTNLRVARVELGPEGGIVSMEQRRAALNELGGDDGSTFEKGLIDSKAPASALFGRIALFLKETMEEFHDDQGSAKAVGFTFSFPSKQTQLNNSTLVVWTKEFETGRDTDDKVEGADVGALLAQHMERLGVNARLVAVCNDTVGTLISARYDRALELRQTERKAKANCGVLSDFFSCGVQSQAKAAHSRMAAEGEVEIGLILGTGVNACYEDPLCQEDYSYIGSVINIEMGNFNVRQRASDFYLETLDGAHDAALDPVTRGKQQLEKMTSGRYTGEIATRLFHLLANEQLGEDAVKASIPEGHVLLTPSGLSTGHAIRIFAQAVRKSQGVAEPTLESLSEHEAIRAKEIEAVLEPLTPELRELLIKACHLTFLRAARVSAIAIYAIAKFAAKKKLDKMIRSLPQEEQARLLEPLAEGHEDEVTDEHFPINLVCAADGSLFVKNPLYVDEIARCLELFKHYDMRTTRQEKATTKVRHIIDLTIALIKADDGSGKGAALAVAAATRGE